MDNFQDPDYEITNVAKEQIRIRQEAEKSRCVDQVRSIIKREFQRELEFREKQLELIQTRITKAAKTLHLLRYCLVTSYYTRNELHFNASQSDLSLLDGQSRIHPAVKKLLGNNPTEFKSTFGLRKKRNLQKKGDNTVIQESNEITLKKEASEENDSTSGDSPMDSSQSESILPDSSNCVRNRKLYKHQIVVGNISKWAPSESPDDSSTHKWMMYVRGPKEFPDISHIVQKVVFFLHPSYKPNDVIEISESPFHLSRRGWGEFPLRVQLYFHGKMNKPVDIIHNLKLDKTYTGRQTLGNETIIELSLYELAKNNPPNCSPTINIPSNLCHVENANENQIIPQQIKTEITYDDEVYQEHIDVKVEIEPTIVSYINLDHSYCQNDGNSTRTTKSKTTEIQNEGNINKSSDIDITTDSLFQVVKKRKPQQSLLKNSILKKIKMDDSNL